jgi:hypothetical protein
MTIELSTPPAAVIENGKARLGRYGAPVPIVNIDGAGLARFRLKEWHYTAITTEDFFVAFAVVQLGYAANLFAYVVPRARPTRVKQLELVVPLGRGLRFAGSSTHGVTTFTHGENVLVSRHSPKGFEIDLRLTLEGQRLSGHVVCAQGASLALVHALSSDRVAYTHKGNLYTTSGHLTFAGTPIPLSAGFATLDWTRSQADRETVWNWASFAGHDTEGRALGLNLSANVYDDVRGDSEENAAYLDGKAVALSGVDFVVPRSPDRMPWRIASKVGDEVSLVFSPLGVRAQNLDLGLVKSNFVQPFGTYAGRVLGRTVEGVFGVVEDHHAVW